MEDTVDVTVYLERIRTGSYLTKVIEVPRHLNNKDKVTFLNMYLYKFYDRTHFEPCDESIRDLGLNDTRDGKPRKLWMYLRIFAKAQGIIFAETFDEPELKQYRKYLPVYASKLNKHLQELFGIKESIYTSHYKKKKPLPGERARLQNGHLGKKIKRKVGYETNIMFSDVTQFVGTKPKPKEQSKSEEIGEMFQGFGEYEKY